MFSGSTKKLCFRDSQGCTLCFSWTWLLLYKNNTSGTCFESLWGSVKAAESWCCVRAGKSISEGVASVAIDGPGLKGSCKDVED